MSSPDIIGAVAAATMYYGGKINNQARNSQAKTKYLCGPKMELQVHHSVIKVSQSASSSYPDILYWCSEKRNLGPSTVA